MTPTLWKIIGFAGQAVFASRFIVQWVVSESKGQSVFPIYFWYASLVGSVLLAAYAISTKDPVFIVGQGFGLLVYSRNLKLIRQQARAEHAA